MNIEIYDNENNIQLYTADITFGLNVLIVNKSNNIDKEKLQYFLSNRAEYPISTEMDLKILKKLNLLARKNEFGRMNEACVLYALLNNFRSQYDSICLYPLQDELINMCYLDYRYSNIYILRKRGEKNSKNIII